MLMTITPPPTSDLPENIVSTLSQLLAGTKDLNRLFAVKRIFSGKIPYSVTLPLTFRTQSVNFCQENRLYSV